MYKICINSYRSIKHTYYLNKGFKILLLSMNTLKDILLRKFSCKSVWFMRQAGRYLPEFRKLRSQNKNFINLCLNSNLSSEITHNQLKDLT